MFQQFVETLGGYWNSDKTLDQGCIERNESVIFVSHTSDVTSEYDKGEIEVLRKRLGREPLVLIDVHIGHEPNSDGLSRDFVSEFLKKWGGIVDDGEEILVS